MNLLRFVIKKSKVNVTWSSKHFGSQWHFQSQGFKGQGHRLTQTAFSENALSIRGILIDDSLSKTT